MATSSVSFSLLALAILLIFLCSLPATARRSDPHHRSTTTYLAPWTDVYWTNKTLHHAEAAEASSVAARRAAAGGYTYGCAMLWLSMGCPSKGVNGTMVDDAAARRYDRQLDHFEEGMRQCSKVYNDTPWVPAAPRPGVYRVGVWVLYLLPSMCSRVRASVIYFLLLHTCYYRRFYSFIFCETTTLLYAKQQPYMFVVDSCFRAQGK